MSEERRGAPPHAEDRSERALEEAVMGTLLRGSDPAWPPLDAARERVRVHWRSSLDARRRRRRAWTVAAAAALVVAAGLAWLARPPAGSSGPRPAGPLATVERVVRAGKGGAAPASALRVDGTAAGAGAAVLAGQAVETAPRTLAALRVGRSSVRLDAASRIEMVGPRSVRLVRGALYVDSPPVAGEPRAGVEVLTPAGRVVELGTQFEVRLQGRTLRLRVREGAVELRAPEDRPRRVERGRELVVEGGKAPTESPAPVAGPQWQWVVESAPTPPLEGATLETLLSWVSRETGVEVVFAQPSEAARARSIVLHGPLDELDPEQAVAVVLPTCGLRGRFETGRLWIEARR